MNIFQKRAKIEKIRTRRRLNEDVGTLVEAGTKEEWDGKKRSGPRLNSAAKSATEKTVYLNLIQNIGGSNDLQN